MNASVFSFTPPLPDQPAPNGLRLAVQPSVSCQGWPADAGSKALENHVALEDAFVIQQLKKAGAGVAGITRMSELGLGLIDDTGSRAVTDNLADAALIVDNMGEARIAAARAGIFGFKPTQGIVSRLGLIGLMPSMECWGILARTMKPIQSIMNTVCVTDDQDFSMREAGLPDFSTIPSLKKAPVIGVVPGYDRYLTGLEAAAWQTALSVMERNGCRIQQIALPDLDLFSRIHQVIGSVEASSSAGKYDGVRYGHRTVEAGNWNEMYLKTRGESFGTLIKSYLFQGACFQFQHYDAFEQACRIRRYLMDETLAALASVDALALLTVRELSDASKAADIEDIYKAFAFTLAANVAGLPAIQVPGLAIEKQRDFGLQLIGKPVDDPALLALADHLGPLTQGGPAS